MKLKPDKKKTSKKERILYVFALCITVAAMVPSAGALKTLLIHKGYVAQKQGAKDKLVELTNSIAMAPLNMLSSSNDIPNFKVDIKYKDWTKLQSDRNIALEEGYIGEERHMVPASVRINGEQLKARVRLQGDMLDHVSNTDRWSLRFELKQKKSLFSMKRFSLVSPHVRVNQGAMLFAETLNQANFDIVSPKHIPVRVSVNGVDWGVMLFEQAFSQSLLAVNNRTEGLILRLDMNEEYSNKNEELVRSLKPRVLQASVVLNNPALSKQRKIALTLANKFLNGDLPASEVFDARKLAQYLATVDVWGAWHALTWNNWRWYYNPHSAKLEPIQSDVAVTPSSHIWLMDSPSETLVISKLMLEDEIVKRFYDESLQHLVSIIDNGSLQTALQQYESQILAKLHSTAPLTSKFDLSLLKRQSECLKTIAGYSPCSPIGTHLHVNAARVESTISWDLATAFSDSDGKRILSIVNNENVDIQIEGISGINRYGGIDPLDNYNLEFPKILLANQQYHLALPSDIEVVSVRGGATGEKMATHEYIRNINAESFLPRPLSSNPDEYAKRFPFLEVDGNVWTIKQGKWEVNEYILTPNNWTVLIESGVQMKFASNAGLMVFGELFVNGTEENPVVLSPKENTTKWSGVTVFGQEGKQHSVVNNLQVHAAGSPKLGLWQPRGANYFVNTFLDINRFDIDNNQSEDALNIVNSDVAIEKLHISDALSDAFDCDFCTGSVNNSLFENVGFRSGGDGIDVSGSKLFVSNTNFFNIRDKAISGGEGSTLEVENVSLEKVNFGIVAKDNTTISAYGVFARQVKHKALMSYCKKNIFGGADLWVSNFHCTDLDCKNKVSVETGSQLKIDGNLEVAKNIDVRNLYDTLMKSDKPQ